MVKYVEHYLHLEMPDNQLVNYYIHFFHPLKDASSYYKSDPTRSVWVQLPGNKIITYHYQFLVTFCKCELLLLIVIVFNVLTTYKYDTMRIATYLNITISYVIVFVVIFWYQISCQVLSWRWRILDAIVTNLWRICWKKTTHNKWNKSSISWQWLNLINEFIHFLANSWTLVHTTNRLKSQHLTLSNGVKLIVKHNNQSILISVVALS